MQSYLCGHVNSLIFIIPTEDINIRERIYDIFQTMIDTLVYLGVNSRKIPNKRAVYPIIEEESRTYDKVKDIGETYT